MPHRLLPCAARLLVLVAAVVLTVACTQTTKREAAPGTAPPPTFTGPPFFRETVGSMASLRDFRETYVSGYTIVTGLHGNGSKEIPAAIKQDLVNEMRKRGVGSVKSKDWPRSTPGMVLDSLDTAVVEVWGIIPPGAARGTRFDLLVRALDMTQTRSLAGGTLLELDLAEGGTIPGQHRFPLAAGRGPIYLSPYEATNTDLDRDAFLRQAVVIKGGIVKDSLPVELVLNQPSWTRSRTISDRINERFGLSTDTRPIADPKSDRLIQINIPQRYAADPAEFLNLISFVWLRGGPGFERNKAQELLAIAKDQPRYRQDIVRAWKVLGIQILPDLQPHYGDEDLDFRMAVLDAGSYFGDERAARELATLTDADDPAVRIAAARSLANLPGTSVAGARALGDLLDDPNEEVRIAAYEAMWRTGDARLKRDGMSDAIIDANGELKFVVQRVPAERPLVYVTQQDVPRIVLFDPDLSFQMPTLARIWDNRLMIRSENRTTPMSVFYQPQFQQLDLKNPRKGTSETYEVWPPTVTSLVRLMGHQPTAERPYEGLNLNFGDVVDALYQLTRSGAIVAPFELRESQLAQRIEAVRESDTPGVPATRPELGETPPVSNATERPERPETGATVGG